ncbi:MAG: lipoyl(octanoyl) transferase LipB, partial [Deferribacterota bacterium]|nr:lipoyl(octanoyl) transferase LipB [Deferribacterota bacterium]
MLSYALNFTKVDYIKAYNLQKYIVGKKIEDSTFPDIIIFLEHLPVFTIGKHASYKNITSIKHITKNRIPIIKTDRGGDITFHNPGQLTIYPIINLKNISLSIKEYVAFLEDLVIDALNKYNIKTNKIDGTIGVFTDSGKIASIGIACKRMITYHGIAINIYNDLTPFKWINPCGLNNINMTNVYNIIEFNNYLKHKLNQMSNQIFIEDMSFFQDSSSK